MKLLKLALLCAAMALGGCATTGQPKQVDPLESMNRKVFGFNEGVDKHILKPISDSYQTITPDIAQTGVSNFFQNLSSVNVIANDFLQGKFKQGFADTLRFTANSTLGLLGFFDVAKDMGLKQHDEDFGQTLAVWGVDSGPYLVLPFLGPTTLRNTASIAVEAVTDPVVLIYPPLLGLEAVDARAKAEASLRFVSDTALDPYTFTREAYLQWRNNLIFDGDPPIEDFYDDDESEDNDAAVINVSQPASQVPAPQ